MITHISRVDRWRLKGTRTHEKFKVNFNVMNHNLGSRTGDGVHGASCAIPTFADLPTHTVYTFEYTQDSSLILFLFDI